MAILPRLARRWHRFASITIAIPFFIVIVSGLLLQLKKEFTWIQPPTVEGRYTIPQLSFERILEATAAVPEAQVDTWGDIGRLDVRPAKGMLKVQCKNGVEVQLDAASGNVLQVATRRSDLIESLHDGSFFTDAAKLWVFLPSSLVVLFLWVSGLYLWWLPGNMRRQKRKRRETTK
jgi:uncharacterized iron-regulated membrane protein